MFSDPNHAIRQVFGKEDDKAMSAIWNKIDKGEGKSQIMPMLNECYDMLRPVFEGDFVLFGGMSGMECSEYIRYSRPDGTKFVVIDQDAGGPTKISVDHKWILSLICI